MDTAQKELNVWRDQVEDDTQKYFQGLIDKVSYYSTDSYDRPELEESAKLLVVLTYDALHGLLYAANEATHWYNNKKMKGKYSNDIEVMMFADRSTSEKRITDYWRECAAVFSAYRDKTIRALQRELNTLENSRTIQQENVKLTGIMKKFQKLQKEFGHIRF